MGSRSSPAPTTYIPEPIAPTIFQSVVPEEDFDRATQYIQDLKAKREAARAERYAEIGTPEEIGQRMKERDAKTETAYLDSLAKPEIDYTAGLQPSVLNNIENFLQNLPAKQLDKKVNSYFEQGKAENKTEDQSAFSEFKPGESATKVDPIANLRNIQSQIVNRRADEANLNRPEGTAQVPTPEPAAPIAMPEPTPEPTPEPEPEPEPTPEEQPKKKESKDFLKKYVSWDGKDFDDYISSDYGYFEDEEGRKLTGGDYYAARKTARPFLNPLREAGLSEDQMQYYAKKAGIRNVNSKSDLEQILKAYEEDR